ARIAGLMLIGTVTAAAGWAATVGEVANATALIALCVAVVSTVMAAVSVWVTHRQRATDAAGGTAPGPSLPAWYGVFAVAWRETSVLAAGLGLALALTSDTFSAGIELHSLAGVFLAATAFLLAWRYNEPGLTWVGSTLILASLFHAFYWKAYGLALLHPFRV